MNDKEKRNIQFRARLEDTNDKMIAAFESVKGENIGCIFYIFDRSENGGGIGFNSKNCDVGDAMIAIKRIVAQFGVDLELLAEGE